MIRVVMFDLGETLVDGDLHPFPHVPEALAAIAQLKATDGQRLERTLVSDYTMAEPATPARVAVLFAEYLGLLERTGLRPHFEPVERRITLSTQAGARKPDRHVFETALQRLGTPAALPECLLITENAAHIRAARADLGMAALQFRSAGEAHFDFDDWRRAPSLIADLVAQGGPASAHQAGAVQAGTGQVWHKVSIPGYRELQDIHVAVPGSPTTESVAEAVSYVRGLAAQGQIAGVGESQRTPTHAITTDAQGNRHLVRKRFSAL